MVKATPNPASSQNQHDEPRQFSADQFVNNPLNHFVLPRRIWFMIRSGELTFIQADILLLTEDFVQMGASREGCWASVRYLASILKISRRTFQTNRAVLLKKNILVKMTLPIKRTSRETYYTILSPPPDSTTCASACAPPLRAHPRAPNKDKKKTKDKNSKSETPAASSGKSLLPSGRDKVFIANESARVKLTARALAEKLHARWMRSPASAREGHDIPPRVRVAWEKNLTKLIDANWSGGEPAVLSLFDRLFAAWDSLPPKDLPTPARLFRKDPDNRSYYYLKILTPAIEKAEAVGKVEDVKFPQSGDPLYAQWQEVQNYKWVDKDGSAKARWLCMSQTAAAMAEIRRRLKTVAATPTHDDRIREAARYVHMTVVPVTPAKYLLELRDFVAKTEGKLNYASPNITMSVAKFAEHRLFKRILEKVKNESVRRDLVSAVKEVVL